MPKPRSRVADYSVYLVIRIAVCLIQAMSLDVSRSVANFLAWLGCRLDRRHREVALDNLRQAFPGRFTEPRLRRLVLDVYRHFCLMIIEMVHLPRKLRVHNWKNYAEARNVGGMIRGLLSGRPVLIVTGHFGNWEMAGYVLGVIGFKTYAIARPLDNPYVEKFLRKFRERTGQQLIAKKGDFERLEELLRDGCGIATLGDQDAGQRGLFVDFFGRPTSTHKAIALLALEHGAHLTVCAAHKLGEPMQYAIECSDYLSPAALAAEPGGVRGITQRFTSAFERLVRLDPRQYFWLHRRWKHHPPVKKGRAAA